MPPETEKKSDSHQTGTPRPMPAVFFGHGSPMNAVEENRYTASWRTFGETVPRPRAILVVSAHWYVNATAVTAMPRPRTIHDFYGFPQELFEVEYPAPGSPELAEEVADIVKPKHVGLDQDSWGIDHGTWSVLVHAFPKADIPVVQLSMNALKDFDSHVELGARLAPLRERGVLIVGSGNIVHNLRALDWHQPDAAFDWARRFDEAARTVLTEKPTEVPSLRNHAEYARSAPTPDHLIPLLYIAGLAGAANRPLELLIDGHAYGSISMAAYTLDAKCPAEAGDTRPSAGLPDPSIVPPVNTNV
jgi:4,5-DOPA dioxygenase extradiol